MKSISPIFSMKKFAFIGNLPFIQNILSYLHAITYAVANFTSKLIAHVQLGACENRIKEDLNIINLDKTKVELLILIIYNSSKYG